MQRAVALLLAAVLCCAAISAHARTVCQTYVVQAGDTVSTIAQQFSLTIPQLESALSECDLLVTGYQPGDFLQANQRICLPGWVSACLNVQSAGDVETCKYYTVQQGDTLDTIGNYFGIPRAEIVDVNPNINPATLAVNSFVKIPDWDSSVCPEPGNTASCRVYVAESGDSLSLIATAFSVPLTELQATNTDLGGDANAVLQPGQRVKLPPFPDNCGAGVPVPKPSNCRAYQVLPGDTIASIAAMFQSSASDVVAVNPDLAAGGVLAPGTLVKLPPVDESCVNPQIVTGMPSPPMPPSPPPQPPSPPTPPAMMPEPEPTPTPAEPVDPVEPEAPAPAPEAAPAPDFVDVPAPAPAPGPEAVAEPIESPPPAPLILDPIPEPTVVTPNSGAAGIGNLLLALLAAVGAAMALL